MNSSYYITEYIGPGGAVTIPSVAVGIEENGFYNCDSITSIYIPDTLKTIRKQAFRFCDNLERVTIGTGVTGIGIQSFADCPKLSEVRIKGTPLVIGGYAFSQDISLKTVSITDKLKETFDNEGTFVSQVFSGTPWLETNYPDRIWDITYGGTYGTKLTGYYGTGTDIVIPDYIKEIGYNSFFACMYIKSITVPIGVQSIAANAFVGCNNVKALYLPATLVEIGSSMFYKTVDIYYDGTREHLVNNVTGGATAFKTDSWHYDQYKRYNTLTLPESLTSIEEYAFDGTSAQVIVIPESLQKASATAFAGCANLIYIFNRSDCEITTPDGAYVINE